MQDERSLAQQAQQGDKEAFAQLYESHFDRIYRYVMLRLGDKAEAEDMTQQVFLKAYESVRSFKWKGIPFSAWLFRIAHNLVVDHLRRQRRRPSVSLEEALPVSDSDPQREAERRVDIERVVSATKQLTGLQREVISLRFAGGLSVAEVARVLGKSEGAVKALQHSAIVALRRAMIAGEDSEPR